jgi:hypothetical protein
VPIRFPSLFSCPFSKARPSISSSRAITNREVVSGKIIRSGYMPHNPMAINQYGTQYSQAQAAYAVSEQPIIELDGKLRFGLPGTPLFPALGDDTVLKPTLQWVLSADKTGPVRAEFSYVTGGLTWQADYNIVAPEKGNAVEIVGWITMDNQSGKDFQNARIKLMAGDVNKIRPGQGGVGGGVYVFQAQSGSGAPPVTERTFDEYHLYSLAHPTTLHDRETKQVEFIRAANVSANQVYVYDGVKLDRYNGWSWQNIRTESLTGRSRTRRSGSCGSLRTQKRITLECRCQKAASAFIAATMTAKSSLRVRT